MARELNVRSGRPEEPISVIRPLSEECSKDGAYYSFEQSTREVTLVRNRKHHFVRVKEYSCTAEANGRPVSSLTETYYQVSTTDLSGITGENWKEHVEKPCAYTNHWVGEGVVSATSLLPTPERPSPARIRLKRVLAWIMIAAGGFFAFDGLMCTCIGFSVEGMDLVARILFVLISVAITLGSGAVCRKGIRLLIANPKLPKAATPRPAEPPKVDEPPKEELPKEEPPKVDELPKTEEKPKPVPTPGPKKRISGPVVFDGTSIDIDSESVMAALSSPAPQGQHEFTAVMPLTEKDPVIRLYEDGQLTREYCLQTEGEEDFSGKYFHIGVRIGMLGSPPVPVAQIDGFVTDTPEERKMTVKDIGYRMEGHFLRCGGISAKLHLERIRGQDLVAKGLKYVGYTTPSNVRLIGICQDCGKSLAFHGYAFYMMQCDAAYSDDGQDCFVIEEPISDYASWSHEQDGKTFRYYNSFCCPHCGAPYIDYQKFPANKAFGVSGCVHLGRKAYRKGN